VKYSDIVNPETMEKAIWSAMLAIQDQASTLAPVDMGALRNSISIAVSGKENGFNSRGGEQAPEDARITQPDQDFVGKVGTAIVYGAAQEFGRPEVGLPSQAYLRPAAALVKAKLGGYFTPEIKKAAAELARKRKVQA
jgi:hypothetical protein